MNINRSISLSNPFHAHPSRTLSDAEPDPIAQWWWMRPRNSDVTPRATADSSEYSSSEAVAEDIPAPSISFSVASISSGSTSTSSRTPPSLHIPTPHTPYHAFSAPQPTFISDDPPVASPIAIAADDDNGFDDLDTPMSPAALFLAGLSTPSPSRISSQLKETEEGSRTGGYTLGPVLGRGAFSTVRKATSISSGGTVAVKIILKSALPSKIERDHLAHEESVWKRLNHEHILPLFSSHHTSTATFFFTLLCPPGSLLDILNRSQGKLERETAATMFRQITRGLKYLHESEKLVHRDMKLENVMVDECGSCRISDFGLAVRFGEDASSEEELEVGKIKLERKKLGLPNHLTLPLRSSNPRHRNTSPFPSNHQSTTTIPSLNAPPPPNRFPAGSLPYIPPELLSTPLPPPHPSQDIWALGCILHALLTGSLPFHDTFEPRLVMKILRGWELKPEGNVLSVEEEVIIRGLLEAEWRERWIVEKVDREGWRVGGAREEVVDVDVEIESEGISAINTRGRVEFRDDGIERERRKGSTKSKSRSTSRHPLLRTSKSRSQSRHHYAPPSEPSSSNSPPLSPISSSLPRSATRSSPEDDEDEEPPRTPTDFDADSENLVSVFRRSSATDRSTRGRLSRSQSRGRRLDTYPLEEDELEREGSEGRERRPAYLKRESVDLKGFAEGVIRDVGAGAGAGAGVKRRE